MRQVSGGLVLFAASIAVPATFSGTRFLWALWAVIAVGSLIWVALSIRHWRTPAARSPTVSLSFAAPSSCDRVRMTRDRESYDVPDGTPYHGGSISANVTVTSRRWEEERLASFAWANVVNDQCSPGVGVTAESVRCYVEFSSPTTVWAMSRINGRWREAENPLSSPEKFSPFKTNPGVEAISIPADGEPHSLDVAFKYPDDAYAYAYNNESYLHGNDWSRKPEYRITELEFIATVTISGENFPTLTKRYWVSHGGEGTTLSIREYAGE